MDERSDAEKGDEIMLPGFRFHPTDEELVGFYLKRKIQQKPLSIELIRQLDIYKYDPWDLPKLATTGEKEWYFYCPRDRKYRNSARPNRVTGAGFWKATGTDRPIYSSEGTKCIGLKKSLVFYKGRAAKGIKTDWMMHEFRLPSLTDSSLPKRPLDKDIPPNDSWAICRIFKKTNSVAQRALSHSWVSQLPDTNESEMFSASQAAQISPQFNPQILQCTAEVRPSSFQFSCNSNLQQQQQCNTISYPPLDLPPYKHINQMINCKQSLLPITHQELPPSSFMISPSELQVLSKCNLDVASMLLNLSPAVLGDVHDKASASIDFGGQQQHQHQHQQQQCINPFPVAVVDLPLVEVSSCLGGNGATPAAVSTKRSTTESNACSFGNNMNSAQWVAGKATAGFTFGHPPNFSDEWKVNMLPWDSPAAPPCPSEISTSYNSCTTTATINNNNKCYT